jgi:hypothetical protein
MALFIVPPAQLPLVWATVAPMLQRAIDIDPDLNKIELVEYMIRIGQQHLMIWEDPETSDITGAATVSIVDYSTERVAVVNLMGGKGIVKDHVFEQAKEWMRSMGATKAQCMCRSALVPMYEKMGMENTHHVMRITL